MPEEVVVKEDEKEEEIDTLNTHTHTHTHTHTIQIKHFYDFRVVFTSLQMTVDGITILGVWKFTKKESEL